MGTMTFAPEQAEKLAEIGAYLQQVRQEKSLSLEAVAAKTMIRQSILEAIEAGQSEYLPEPVYTQGFIRRFAETLGLDGQAIAQQFPAHTLSPMVEQPQAHKKLALPSFQFRPIHLYLLYVVLVVGAIAALSYLLKPASGPNGVRPQASPTPAAPASPQNSPASPSPVAASPTPSPSPQAEPIKVGVNITQDAWLEVLADGEVVYEGILVSGDNKTWTAKEKIVLRTGNAGAVMVSFNNNPAQAMGQFGAIEEKIYAASDPSGATDASLASPSPLPSP
ncbi:DUF4115 domain-containing protein [Thermosynechococcaceae cyanobacterium BACA0444]|uniref:DUF4115 domain-containing protein n=1 Tax=Pseudocalidococcus azoricus BACA0444 TaxID=2918990 RepID=A0AAE4FQY4_9CYAN|nr:RodZ domain-containing protein [Pseudocalidococcus azoricus]MDS3859405.1 DUF4115 domain-containing protein [Pseudocalidococcus azoricus BACA0444]